MQESARVSLVRREDEGYRVRSRAGDFLCRALVLATGNCNLPRVPQVAEALTSVGDSFVADAARGEGKRMFSALAMPSR